jgi:hypothetical protein
MITIYDNFFSNNVLNAIIDRSKNTELYTFEEHKKRIENYNIGYWYGKRSYNLVDVDQLLNALILDKLFFRHLFHRPVTMIDSYIHQRSNNDKDDYIHIDPADFSLIVYLSPSNLSSGTKFYTSTEETDKDNETMFVKYVQNRAVLFHSGIAHAAYKNFGNDINNSRLTLNAFLKFY